MNNSLDRFSYSSGALLSDTALREIRSGAQAQPLDGYIFPQIAGLGMS